MKSLFHTTYIWLFRQFILTYGVYFETLITFKLASELLHFIRSVSGGGGQTPLIASAIGIC